MKIQEDGRIGICERNACYFLEGLIGVLSCYSLFKAIRRLENNDGTVHIFNFSCDGDC